MPGTLAITLAPKVRVNAIAPAFTDTRWIRGYFGDHDDRMVAHAVSNFTVCRIATPEEVAAAIVSLVRRGGISSPGRP